MGNGRLDSYSMLIVSNYFHYHIDYINLMCVCKKFKETTEKLRYNPIPITSLKFFPKIQTQYLYGKDDIKIEGIDKYEIWYNVDYDQYLKFNEDNIKCHHVLYTKDNINIHGNEIPIGVNMLSTKLYYSNTFNSITIPNYITSIGDGCFYWCSKLKSITIPNCINTIPTECFCYCNSLTSISIFSTIQSLGTLCFYNCLNICNITIPCLVTSIKEGCFSYCTSLQSVILPVSLQYLDREIFDCCESLTNVVFPTSLISIGDGCFYNCNKLTGISLPSTLQLIGSYCFSYCSNLSIIDGVKEVQLGEYCFEGCIQLKIKPTNIY
ncbi:hypothetical protein QTN25_007717 [Entamoeba marina]